jgi:hypothetical protein
MGYRKIMSKNYLEKSNINDFSTIDNSQLSDTKLFVYDLCGFKITQIHKEVESAEYGAYKFKLNNFNVLFRTAKNTPTKVGQFVTFWKRNFENGPIQPYDISDEVDFFVISVHKGENFGQFIFPKSVLSEKDIISKNNIGGKRAMRVYPPWDKTTSKRAEKTQRWQLLYFLSISKNESC